MGCARYSPHHCTVTTKAHRSTGGAAVGWTTNLGYWLAVVLTDLRLPGQHWNVHYCILSVHLSDNLAG